MVLTWCLYSLAASYMHFTGCSSWEHFSSREKLLKL